MKKIILLFVCCVLLLPAQSQYRATTVYEKNGMPVLQRKNNTLGIVLVVGGAVTALAGTAIVGSDKSYFPSGTVGTIMIAGGGAAVITGVVLLSSGKAKKQTGRDSWQFDLEMEKTVVPDMYGYQPVWKMHRYPAVSFKVLL